MPGDMSNIYKQGEGGKIMKYKILEDLEVELCMEIQYAQNLSQVVGNKRKEKQR